MAKGKAEVAEAIYQAARATTPAKTAAELGDLNPHAQRRYLTMAEAAMQAIGDPEGFPSDSDGKTLLDRLAEQLAWKLRHPMEFADGVRTVLDEYAGVVGDEGLSDEVRAAREI